MSESPRDSSAVGDSDKGAHSPLAKVREGAKHAFDNMSDKASELKAKVVDKVREANLHERASEQASHLADRAKDGAHTAADKAREGMQTAKEHASTVADAVRTKAREVDLPEPVARELARLQDGYNRIEADFKAQYGALEQKLSQAYEQKRLVLVNEITERLEKKFDEVLEEKVKALFIETVVDPDMPKFLQNDARELAEYIWPDIKEEIWRIYQDAVLKYEDIPEGDPPTCCAPCRPWDRLRASVLYALYPFNKSAWAKIKRPLWWTLMAFRLIPLFGAQTLVFFIDFVLRDKSDEFQLVDFILAFKGSQFITVGILGAMLGAGQYIACVNLDSRAAVVGGELVLRHHCDSGGPAQQPLGLLYYIEIASFAFQIILTWSAFSLLPWSQKKGIRPLRPDSPKRHYLNPNDPNTAVISRPNCCGCNTYERMGGYLRKLIYYDLFCFALVTGLGVWAVFSRPYRPTDGGNFDLFEWQFRADMFWLKTLYGLLSVPFALFILPLLSAVLLHVRPTGYNRAGVCVPKHVLAPRERRRLQEAQAAERAQNGDVVMLDMPPHAKNSNNSNSKPPVVGLPVAAPVSYT